MFQVKKYGRTTALCLVVFFSLSIWTTSGESSSITSWECHDISMNQFQIGETITKINTHDAEENKQGAPTPIETNITLNVFGNWTSDVVNQGGSSNIEISVSSSNGVRAGTQVTLSFGVTVSDGIAQLTATPAEPVAKNQFTFTIGPSEKKTVTVHYIAGSFTGKPKVKAICNMSVPSGITAIQNVQTSTSELWIR